MRRRAAQQQQSEQQEQQQRVAGRRFHAFHGVSPPELPSGYAFWDEVRKTAESVPGHVCFTGTGKYQPLCALGFGSGAGQMKEPNFLEKFGFFYSMYSQLISWQNLLLAYQKAARNKRGQPNVAAFEYRLEDNLLQLQADLNKFTYRPGPYTSFTIHEPKRRLISAAPFRDRVVHHALCNQIEPIFERSFIHDSYANRVGKGTHRALNRCQQFARQYPYALQCDLRQFFPSIDHAILRQTLVRKIDDDNVCWLMEHILASGAGILDEEYDMVWFPHDDLLAALRPRGLPIGNLTSQFWANVYLNPFDHFIKRELRCKAYLRYVDDFLLFADSKQRLWEWKAQIETRLAAFRLTIHPGAHPCPVSEGIPFLGFITFPQRRRLKRRKGVYFLRKLRRQIAQYGAGELSLDDLDAGVNGWINHVRYGNTIGLRRATLSRYKILKTLENCSHVANDKTSSHSKSVKSDSSRICWTWR